MDNISALTSSGLPRNPPPESAESLIKQGRFEEALARLQANDPGYFGLHAAAENGFTEGVKIMLDKGWFKDRLNSPGFELKKTPLHLAASNGHKEYRRATHWSRSKLRSPR